MLGARIVSFVHNPAARGASFSAFLGAFAPSRLLREARRHRLDVLVSFSSAPSVAVTRRFLPDLRTVWSVQNPIGPVEVPHGVRARVRTSLVRRGVAATLNAFDAIAVTSGGAVEASFEPATSAARLSREELFDFGLDVVIEGLKTMVAKKRPRRRR